MNPPDYSREALGETGGWGRGRRGFGPSKGNLGGGVEGGGDPGRGGDGGGWGSGLGVAWRRGEGGTAGGFAGKGVLRMMIVVVLGEKGFLVRRGGWRRGRAGDVCLQCVVPGGSGVD